MMMTMTNMDITNLIVSASASFDRISRMNWRSTREKGAWLSLVLVLELQMPMV
jgi:hypothetical protein